MPNPDFGLNKKPADHSLAQPEGTGDTQLSTGIQILPPEVLSDIFLLSLPQEEIPGDYCSLDPKHAPRSLTHVCKHWRTIAVGHPTLWSTLIVRPSLHPTEVRRIWYPPTSALKLALSRSSPLLLKIQFWDYFVDHNIAKEMFCMLMAVSRRWGEVSFDLDFSLLEALTEVRGNLPHLSRFECRPYGAQTFEEAFDVFEDAPKLEHVSLDVDNMAPYRLPLPQLKTLRGPIPGNIELLREAPLLEELEIQFLGLHGLSTMAQPRINHAALRRLKTNALTSLQRLTVPSLSHLEICPPSPFTVTIRDIVGFADNSRCSLTSLTMTGMSWDQVRMRDVRDLLNCVPRLVRLEIREDAQELHEVPWDLVIESLTIADSTEEILVPHLASVRFVAKSPVTIPNIEKALSTMLDSRYKQSGDPNGLSSEIIGFSTRNDVVT